MINLSWLIFPKVSRVVPAGGRGKDTGRRRRTRRKRGNTRRKRRRDAGGGMGRRGRGDNQVCGGRGGGRGNNQNALERSQKVFP